MSPKYFNFTCLSSLNKKLKFSFRRWTQEKPKSSILNLSYLVKLQILALKITLIFLLWDSCKVDSCKLWVGSKNKLAEIFMFEEVQIKKTMRIKKTNRLCNSGLFNWDSIDLAGFKAGVGLHFNWHFQEVSEIAKQVTAYIYFHYLIFNIFW